MQNAQPNLFTRPDTFFGVCEGLGEDLRIHPNFFRLAMAGLLFWNPAAAIAVYACAGALVALTRWLVPSAGPAAAPSALGQSPAAVTGAAAEHEPPRANEEADRDPVPLAA